MVTISCQNLFGCGTLIKLLGAGLVRPRDCFTAVHLNRKIAHLIFFSSQKIGIQRLHYPAICAWLRHRSQPSGCCGRLRRQRNHSVDGHNSRASGRRVELRDQHSPARRLFIDPYRRHQRGHRLLEPLRGLTRGVAQFPEPKPQEGPTPPRNPRYPAEIRELRHLRNSRFRFPKSVHSLFNFLEPLRQLCWA